MDGCKLDVLWSSIGVYILLHFSFSTSLIHASGSGFQTRLFEGITHVHLLRCIITETSNLFLVDILQLTPNKTKLAMLIFQTKECKTNRTFVSCVFNETPPAVVLSAVITDLEEGETRTYQCTTFGYEREDKYNVSITWDVLTTTWTAGTTWTANTTSTAPGDMTDGTVGIDWASFAYGGAATLVAVLLTHLAGRWLQNKFCKGTKRAQDVTLTREEPVELDLTAVQADEVQHSRGGDTQDIVSAAEPLDDNASYTSLRMDDVGLRSPYQTLVVTT